MPTNNSSNIEVVPGGSILHSLPAPQSGSTETIIGRDSVDTITGAKTFAPGKLISAPGTTSEAVQKYTPTGAVLKTTPAAGDVEVDANGVPYYSQSASQRGVWTTEQFMALTAAYTLTSQTAAQKLFNSTANGALTVVAGKTYFFECFFSLTSMSTSSGNFGFSFGGTAAFTQSWQSSAVKAALATPTTGLISFNTAASTGIATASTSATGHATIKGVLRVTGAGTLIPQVSLTIAAAAIVGVNSYIRLIPVGTNTVNNIGNWS